MKRQKKKNFIARLVSSQLKWTGSKKNLQNFLGLDGRINLLKMSQGESQLSISAVSRLLDVNRSSFYYKSVPISDLEIKIKNKIDEIHTEFPTWGSRQMSKMLQKQGYDIGRHKTKRYMNEMNIYVIYPKPSLSSPAKGHKIYPYLLRNACITRANQAWSIDITYIRLKHGFVYLTAIIDWYSRCIVGWELDDTLSTTAVELALGKAFKIATPEIMNSDQGSQFTSSNYIELVKSMKCKISMDGKERWADNIWIERWFRTLKYDEVYLNNYENIKEARKQIGEFINKYNFVKLHSSLNYETPASWYYPILLEVTG